MKTFKLGARINAYEYRGHIIHVNHEPGHRLKYSVVGVGAANTLTGIKNLIKSHTK